VVGEWETVMITALPAISKIRGTIIVLLFHFQNMGDDNRPVFPKNEKSRTIIVPFWYCKKRRILKRGEEYE
jgi:hypothetical protein